MATPQELAALFARTLDLFRDPAAKDEQKSQFRALASLLKLEPVTIGPQDGRLVINGTLLNPGSNIQEYALVQRLEFHAVKEINIPADPPIAEAFELLRALAEPPGDEDIVSRLKARGASRITVTMHSFTFEAPAPPLASVPQHEAPKATKE